MNRLIFIGFLAIMGLICCNTPPSKEAEMQFRVKPDLLGDSIHLHKVGVSFSPPVSFERLDKETTTLSVLGETPFVSSLNNFEVFTDSSSKAEMWVIEPDLNVEKEFLTYNEYLLDSLSTQDSVWQSAMLDSFPYNGFDVKQLLLQSEDLIAFFLIFSHPDMSKHRPFLCSYSVPRASYTPSLIQSIESSIGSFSPL